MIHNHPFSFILIPLTDDKTHSHIYATAYDAENDAVTLEGYVYFLVCFGKIYPFIAVGVIMYGGQIGFTGRGQELVS